MRATPCCDIVRGVEIVCMLLMDGLAAWRSDHSLGRKSSGGGWEESGGEERIDCGRRSDGDRPESVRILDISTASILPQPSKRELD